MAFEDGLRATIDWYVGNPGWLANVRSGAYMAYYEQQYAGR